MIHENLLQVEEKIQRACDNGKRSRKDVTLIAVSKTKPIEDIYEAIESNIMVFGENKVQDLVAKMDTIDKPVEWHFIGHLQRNKVKYLVGRVALIHSVDSFRLAEQINIESKNKNVVTNVLIEVNMAREESKYGVMPEDAESLIHLISKLTNIKVLGLMTIAPYTQNAEENRNYFKNLRKLLVDINAKNIDNVIMSVLSMGMTGDYTIAIEEGATYIRVGTGIFGAR